MLDRDRYRQLARPVKKCSQCGGRDIRLGQGRTPVWYCVRCHKTWKVRYLESTKWETDPVEYERTRR